MDSHANKNRLYATTLGYYSHDEGARYISPLVTGASFPDLVELHESLHAYLALSNWTDGIARLFIPLIQFGEKELSKTHLNNLTNLFRVINDNTVYTHEVIATYLSFHMFHYKQPNESKLARMQLPPFYEKALADGETSFGKIEEENLPLLLGTIVNACAIAAMNLLYSPEFARLKSLTDCASFIKMHSPDKRFKQILGVIRPPQKGRNSFFDFDIYSEDVNYVQKQIFKKIRESIPNLKFITHDEYPTIFREWVEILKSDAVSYGYRFLENKTVQPHPDDTALERFGANITFPQLKEYEPRDLSLKNNKYAKGTLEELVYDSQVCFEEGRSMLCNVFNLPNYDGVIQIVCFPSFKEEPKTTLVPIVISCHIQEFIDAINLLPRQSLILKVDERWANETAPRLAKTNHLVFVLIHDTRPNNISRYISSIASTQNVFFIKYNLSSDNFSVWLAYAERDNFTVLAPITRLGTELIEKHFEKNIHAKYFASGEDAINKIKIKESLLRELLITCYAGNL